MANHISVHLGLLEQSVCLECRELLSGVWRGTGFPEIEINQYMKLLSKDKKNVGNKLNLILTRGLGDMFMQVVVPDDGFVAVVDKCLKSYFGETARD
jgi:3-dehydroquinate synthetase